MGFAGTQDILGTQYGWWFGNVWNMAFIYPYIGNVIIPIPTDFHSYFSEG